MSPQNNLNEWKVSKEFNNQRIDYWLKKNFIHHISNFMQVYSQRNC